ncbi:MAG TPA: DNA recombination protein RmuC [Thermodesulfovibrionales bacterium]|jgi:DNA recombination protein RmuC|nr:DNA recombination protein RmuC [Thermodesulfovibrionales bacterium]HZV46983.1 DNA recombination protein RmuC [Thermodesulfovibrionales bacterium]
MDIMLSVIIGILIGGISVWFIASSLQQKKYMGQIAGIQSSYTNQIAELREKASGAEARIEEIRQQLRQKESEIGQTRDELDTERESKARLEESRKHLKEEIERFQAMESKLSETFKALSLDALSKNSDEFLKLAEKALEAKTSEGKKELESKKELIDQNIEAIGKTLSEVQKRIEDVGRTSGEKFSEVTTLIKKHEDVTSKLKETTERLSHALASPKKRGEWGERMAEDIIRLVGMVEGINYMKQKTLESSSGRPDYTFFLPNNLKINMDVKFPVDNYMHYLNAEAEHDRKRFRDELLKNTKVMIKQVTTRDYINPSENTIDYVIMFIPNEQVFSFINESDTTIMDEALKQKVILCSPFTLYAVLAVIRQAVENFNLEKTASEILKLLGEFSKQWNAYKEKFMLMGERLDAAKKEYDTLITTRTNMLERPLKKIEDLRGQKAIDLEEQLKLDEAPLL